MIHLRQQRTGTAMPKSITKPSKQPPFSSSTTTLSPKKTLNLHYVKDQFDSYRQEKQQNLH
jgi:hypothetical protein